MIAKSKWYPKPFLSLFSDLLQITAVICWSRKIRIQHKSPAGIAYKNANLLKFSSKIDPMSTSQFLPLEVVKLDGTCSFLVEIWLVRSTSKQAPIVMTTPKLQTRVRNQVANQLVFRSAWKPNARSRVRNERRMLK